MTEQMINGIADTVTHEMKRCLAQHLEVIEQRFDNAESVLKKIEDQNASIDKRLLNLETRVARGEEELAKHTALFQNVVAYIDTVPSPEPHSHQILPRQLQKVSGCFVLAGDQVLRLRIRLASGLFSAWSFD